MVLQCKTRTSFLDLLESPDPANKKRKQDQKEKEVMEERKNLPPKEAEPYKRGKYARVTQTRSSSEGVIVYRRGDHQIEVLAWTPFHSVGRRSSA